MDKNTFIKKTRNKGTEQYSNYVLRDDLMNKLYFEVTPIAKSKANYPETWEKLHFHEFYMAIWFKNGRGVHIVDSEEYSIKGGRLFFLNPNQLHTFKDYDLIEGTVITFSEELFNLMCPRLADYIKYEIFSRQGKCLFCDTNIESDYILGNILKQMISENNKIDSYGHHYIISAIFVEFMMQAERLCMWSQDVKRNINSTSYQTYLNFISLIEANFIEEKKVDWYARRLGISVVLLSRYVKLYNRDTTLTPLKIINNRVFIEAERKLKHSNDSVSRIAYTLGFKNDSNFIKFFKKNDIKKRTPKQFREEWG